MAGITHSKVSGVADGSDTDLVRPSDWNASHVVEQVITDNAVVTVDDASAADNDYAKFTAIGVEGRSYTEVKQDLSLDNVTNDAQIAKSLLTEQGDVIYASAASTPAALAHGDAGDLLKSGGHAANPAWQSVTATLTAMLANTLAENDLIQLEELLSADAKYSGIACNGVYGATLAYGKLIYLNNDDGRWELADADAAATCSPQLGIALEAGNDGDTKKVFLIGYIREDDWDWATVGAPLFVSATDGDMTQTAPSGTGDVIRTVGYAKTADSIFFNPSPDWFEHV